MPPQPRGRACQNCQSIKIKCELGAHGGEPPCERCVRLGKTNCTLAAPKRQKDRVAELEAKVEALTKLLGSHGIQDASDEARDLNTPSAISERSSIGTVASSQKKRRLEEPTARSDVKKDSMSPEDAGSDSNRDGWTALDRLISVDLQQRVLDEYIACYQNIFPAVPLPIDSSAEVLRRTRPHTLHAVVFIASSGILSWDLQDRINLSLVEDLTSKTIVQCKKSLDLLQALQITCMWYRSPRNTTQIPLFQLIALASEMVINLGFGGLQSPSSWTIDGVPEELLGGIEACRAWLVSYIITETNTLLQRKLNEQRWGPHHDQCLLFLEMSTLPSDTLLAQNVRSTRLLASIRDSLDLDVASLSPEVGTTLYVQVMHQLQTEITQFRLQTPLDMWSPSLTFTNCFADVLLHEPILQTPTNKPSFLAPFTLDKISTSDIPNPPLTAYHFTAVHALKTACHTLLDAATSFSDSELITLPTLIFAPRLAQVVILLLRLHVAATVPHNTYGQIVSAQDLQADAYIDKCLRALEHGIKIDAEAFMVRMLKYTGEVKEWLRAYEAARLGAVGSGEFVKGGCFTQGPEFFGEVDFGVSGGAEIDWADFGLSGLFDGGGGETMGSGHDRNV